MAPMQPNRQAQNQGASGHQRNNNNNNQANTAVVPYNSQQANRGRGNNNNFRGRGNNRANYQQWNRRENLLTAGIHCNYCIIKLFLFLDIKIAVFIATLQLDSSHRLLYNYRTSF
jgi:hypothetical protein